MSDPTAITGSWSDLERHARYVYQHHHNPHGSEWALAEAVLVLLGDDREKQARLAAASALVEAAKEALKEAVTLAPADCTGDCGYGPCNCSGEYRFPERKQKLADALAAFEQAQETR